MSELGPDQLQALLGSWPECRTWQEGQVPNLLHRAILRQSTTLSSEWLQAWHSVHGTYKSLEDQTLSWRLETSNLLHQCRVWQQSPTHHCSMHAPTSLCGCNLFVLCIQYMTCHMRLSAVFIAKIRTSGPIPSLPLILNQQQKIYIWLSANRWFRIQSLGL